MPAAAAIDRLKGHGVPLPVPCRVKEDNPLIESAKRYTDWGWHVFPVDDQKRPRTKNGFKDASLDPDQFKKGDRIAIRTGQVSGLVVVDLDEKNGKHGIAEFKRLMTGHPDISTRTVKTPTGGAHIYFTYRGSLKTRIDHPAPGIDLKAEGGYVVAPPSVMKTGDFYQVIKDIEPADLPDWLIEVFTAPDRDTNGKPGTAKKGLGVAPPFKAPDKIQAGRRNDTLHRTACSLAAKGIGDSSVLAAVQEENKVKCSPPLDDNEVKTLVSSAVQFNRQHPPQQKDHPISELYTQIRIADQFIEAHLDKWRYNVDRKQWFFWNGQVWEADECDQIHNVVKEFLREYLLLIPSMAIDKTVVELTKFIVSLNTAKGIRDILAIASPGMTIRDLDLDTKTHLLVCQNGTLDLTTEEFREHRRDDFCSKITNTDYVPGASCPLWEQHISTVFDDDTKLIDSVQELLGYSLFLGNPDAVFTVFFGSGRNGKTVTLEAISYLLGKYATTVSPNSFMADGDRAGSDRILMRGARLITASEPADSSKKRCELDTGFIKGATGDDYISARRLYCEGTSFKVQGLVVLTTNALPKIHDQSIALWDRLWCVPFNHYFMPEDRDTDIAEKLKSECPGILNWLITGYKRYVDKTRLIPCAAITDQTEEYRRDEDFYSPFFDAGIVTIDPKKKTGKIQASKLYSLFVSWFEHHYPDKKPTSSTKFGRDMSTRFRKEKKEEGIFYLGIGEHGQQKVSL